MLGTSRPLLGREHATGIDLLGEPSKKRSTSRLRVRTRVDARMERVRSHSGAESPLLWGHGASPVMRPEGGNGALMLR